MINVTSESSTGACVVHLTGSFEAAEDPRRLVDRIIERAGTVPLLVDLGGIMPSMGPQLEEFVRGLAAAPSRATTVLIHPLLEVRRSLRATSLGLPVLPSNELVRRGCFASAIAAGWT